MPERGAQVAQYENSRHVTRSLSLRGVASGSSVRGMALRGNPPTEGLRRGPRPSASVKLDEVVLIEALPAVDGCGNDAGTVVGHELANRLPSIITIRGETRSTYSGPASGATRRMTARRRCQGSEGVIAPSAPPPATKRKPRKPLSYAGSGAP